MQEAQGKLDWSGELSISGVGASQVKHHWSPCYEDSCAAGTDNGKAKLPITAAEAVAVTVRNRGSGAAPFIHRTNRCQLAGYVCFVRTPSLKTSITQNYASKQVGKRIHSQSTYLCRQGLTTGEDSIISRICACPSHTCYSCLLVIFQHNSHLRGRFLVRTLQRLVTMLGLILTEEIKVSAR